MIELKNKQDCCGCSACEQVCPVKAITMESDRQGFLYPSINNSVCVDCNRCNSVCPIKHAVPEKEFPQQALLLQHKNKKILLESSSGGSFTAIAQIILAMNGVVFGAAYDDNFTVRHTYVDNEEDLKIFRNSKYVQSVIGDSYKKVKDFIKEKRYVCFSGTPCQIEGLLNFLGSSSPYLYTVDVVCHAVPSPAVWKSYLEMVRESNQAKLLDLRFRDKSKYGYLYSQFATIRENERTNYEGIETNRMLRAFFSEICNRPSCYDCHFKKRYRRSDFTIWDCFDFI